MFLDYPSQLKRKNVYFCTLPKDYNDVCPICLEKLNSNVCKISNCNCHYYHVNCINKYISNGFTKCSICNV